MAYRMPACVIDNGTGYVYSSISYIQWPGVFHIDYLYVCMCIAYFSCLHKVLFVLCVVNELISACTKYKPLTN